MSKKENKSSNKNDELKIESIAKINDFQDFENLSIDQQSPLITDII